MEWRLGFAIGAVLLVAGCGHDDGASSEQAALSGVFQAGNVSGVQYQADGVLMLAQQYFEFAFLTGAVAAL
jgi:hypothetical protein